MTGSDPLPDLSPLVSAGEFVDQRGGRRRLVPRGDPWAPESIVDSERDEQRSAADAGLPPEAPDCPDCGRSWRPGHRCEPPARPGVERRHPGGLLVVAGERVGEPWPAERRRAGGSE